MPTRAETRATPKPDSRKTESLRTRLERMGKKRRPSLVALIDSLPPGTRSKEDIDREFEELRGSVG